MLLLDQVADPVKDLLVVHLGSSDPGRAGRNGDDAVGCSATASAD
jgi:hypothetical protein